MLEAQLAALVAQRIDEGLLDRQAVVTLLDQGPRAVRQYQFVGELAQTLDYFNQRFLTATEEGTLRKTIREQGLSVEQALNGLLDHVINEVLFDKEERSAMRERLKLAGLQVQSVAGQGTTFDTTGQAKPSASGELDP